MTPELNIFFPRSTAVYFAKTKKKLIKYDTPQQRFRQYLPSYTLSFTGQIGVIHYFPKQAIFVECRKDDQKLLMTQIEIKLQYKNIYKKETCPKKKKIQYRNNQQEKSIRNV